MTIFQLLSVLFALFMSYVTFLHYKKKAFSKGEASFWFSMWSLFVILAVFPHLLTGVTGILHFSRVFDLLVVGAFMTLTVIVFSNYFKQKYIQHKLEDLVRDIALNYPTRTTAPSKSSQKAPKA